MKIARRSFLSFLIGGAAGTALTPLPWKLTDDLSIWSQNWPWTPVPPKGAANHVNSVCSLCPGGCGITVRKIDERAVKIEGMDGYPGNDGSLCTLCLAGLQLLYGPSRVQAPMKRVGKRGEGRWQKISWEQALEEVTAKLSDLRAADAPETLVALLGSDRGTVPQLFNRFLTAYGSPNFFRTPSIQDTYELALFLMHGTRSMASFDIENSDFVLSFGSGMIEGWGSSVRMFKAKSKLRDANATVCQIETRLSNTAAKSDKWVSINPGTEAALALGLAHVIIKEARYNQDFITNYTNGFNKFQQLVLEQYSPSNVTMVTGIDPETITSLARSFASARHPLAICGRGQGATPGSLNEFIAVHALNALVGNINQKGGIWAMPEPDYIEWPDVPMDAVAANGMQKGRMDGAGSQNFPHSRYLLNRLPDMIHSGEATIGALMVIGSNPVHTLPDTPKVQTALDKIPYIVSLSSFMDETTQMADIILPNHTNFERYQDVPAPEGLPQPIIGLSQPIVEPQFNTRHAGDIIIQLAQSLGGNVAEALAWGDYETCLQETLGDKWDMLSEQGFWVDESFNIGAWGEAFETDSGKFEFTNAAINRLPLFNPINLDGSSSEYPLVLLPYDSMRISAGHIGNPAFLMKTIEDTVLKGNSGFVEINPQTAASLGLAQGAKAIISTPTGSAEVRVHHFDGIMPGVIAMPRGLGRTAFDKYVAHKGINVNGLIGAVEDPASGLDAAWGTRASLTKA